MKNLMDPIKNCHAISAVFPTLFFIVICFSAGIIFSIFGLGMIGDMTEPEFTQPFSTVIEAVSFNNTGMTLYIRNGFDEKIRVVNVYINEEAYSVYTYGDCVDYI